MAKLSKVVGDQIILEFPYDPVTHGTVKLIPDYRWENKQWSFPATRFHAQRILETLPDFSHDGRVKSLANPPKPFFLQRDKLYEFQSKGVDFLHRSKGRALLGDAPGLGKTVQVLWWLTETPAIQKVLIVAPTSVLGKWEDEIHKWAPGYSAAIICTSAERLPKTKMHLMSYAIMTRRSRELQGYDLVVYDECFYGDTLVATDQGNIPIRDIVDNKLPCLVQSFNLSKDVVEWKQVTGWIKNPAVSPMIKTTHSLGSLICTENHPISTLEDGYVKAKALHNGSHLRILRDSLPGHQEWKVDSEILQPVVFDQIKMGKPRIQNKNNPTYDTSQRVNGVSGVSHLISSKEVNPTVLLSEMWGDKSVQHSRRPSEVCRFDKGETYMESRFEIPGIVSTNEIAQSHVDAGSQREDDGVLEGSNLLSQVREWENDSTPITDTLKNRWLFGVPYWNTHRSEKPFPLPAQGVQGRYRISRLSLGHRSGWSQSQDSQMEISGQQKNGNPIYARVESVEVYQPTSDGERGRSGQSDNYIYCLDVEDNHNFFAGGVLVHNCHYLKDSKSARGKAANVINSPRVIMMSGTPFLNRPIELWNLLTILAPAAYRNWKQFVTRYCDGHPVSIGHNRTVMDTSGASNTRELADRLSDVMIRRTKAEVLTQLPELQRTYMRVDVDSHEITNAVASLRQSLLNNVSYSNVITQLSRLRYTVGMSKVPWVIETATELMTQSEDSKLVIYCHHLDVVSEIRSALLKYGVLTIQGSVSQQERADVQYKFQHGKQSRIMIITSAGGEGIDLFAADTIIFAEREWTPAGEEQAEARLHRIGQKAAVQSIYMVANGTIDEQISALVEKKREVFHEIIGSDVLHTQVIDTNIVADLLRLVREGK